MRATRDDIDPKGLIREAYRIDGITEPDCRTIFLDWALSLPDAHRPGPAIEALLTRYAPDFPDHPMTAVLRAGAQDGVAPRRRGGWQGRRRDG